MVGHGRSSASSYLADPTSPIPSHCASIVATSTLRVNQMNQIPRVALIRVPTRNTQQLQFLPTNIVLTVTPLHHTNRNVLSACA